ncbi:hypothetical protein Sjap_005323 [Stephania japonica]|uniref:Uncharacterized protein n=1 Tax=Stephania japonica TaxID=461633 RepID=A0AAP0PL16_9MAGN
MRTLVTTTGRLRRRQSHPSPTVPIDGCTTERNEREIERNRERDKCTSKSDDPRHLRRVSDTLAPLRGGSSSREESDREERENRENEREWRRTSGKVPPSSVSVTAQPASRGTPTGTASHRQCGHLQVSPTPSVSLPT